jgi:hypothetical protein
MGSFVDKQGKRKKVPSLTVSAMKRAQTKAAARRKDKRRLVRFGTIPESDRYALARGYYGVSRSPRVATAAGRPIQRGLKQKSVLLKRFMRELQQDPEMARAFLSGMYSRHS